MIIPIKCFTCGKVLADKYRYFNQEVRKIKANNDMEIEKVKMRCFIAVKSHLARPS